MSTSPRLYLLALSFAAVSISGCDASGPEAPSGVVGSAQLRTGEEPAPTANTLYGPTRHRAGAVCFYKAYNISNGFVTEWNYDRSKFDLVQIDRSFNTIHLRAKPTTGRSVVSAKADPQTGQSSEWKEVTVFNNFPGDPNCSFN